MKTLSEFITERLLTESEINSESEFREYAENKFKETFGDELDEDQMNEVINGLLDDNKDLVERNQWGDLIGKLNMSFAH